MRYYDPNERGPRRWAVCAAAAYALLLGLSFAFVSFDFDRIAAKPGEEIEIEFFDPPVPEPPQPAKSSPSPRIHEAPAPAEHTAQTEGRDETTRTPNPRALFNMNKSGADEPANAGNTHAREGEEKSSGTGPGLNPDGLDQIDKGLQGRGLVGSLPRPSYPGNQSGKIVVRVTVGPKGDVTSAAFEPKGSTVSDPQLVEAALAAARKARFTESRAAVQGGTITYVFRMK
ncbi:MAG: TonB family protein [Alistipes sp.]|nr:TonB family protein [Alistipes sp.]